MTTTAAVCGPRELPDAIAGFIVRKSGLPTADVRAIVDSVIADAGEGAVERLCERMAQPSEAWTYYPRDPLAWLVHQRFADVVLTERPLVTGTAHLDTLGGRPAIIVANHLSYSDANVVEVLLQQSGCGRIADRLAVIAGPKVYSDPSRRFSSLCFGTIKSPQNEGVSSGEASMAARQVALAAAETLRTARQRLEAGDVLLVFPEGTRSRNGGMQPFLPGVSRYFDGDDVLIVPVGLCGTEQMFAIGEERLGSAKVTMNIGAPLAAATIRAAAGSNRRRFVDAVGAAVAAQLPAEYRGVYA